MSEKGRRLVFVGNSRAEVETFDVPEPGPGQVLVRVTRSQVSAGSEKNQFLRPSAPGNRRSSGYTTVGRVMALGAGVDNFKPGDRVLTFGNHASHLLTHATWTGRPAKPDSRPPDLIRHDVTDEQAAFAVLGSVALHGVRRAQLQIDESVAIFGLGVVGHLLTALCRISGSYPIIGVDLDKERLALSREAGATHTVDASREDAEAAVRAITGDGAACVFHATGEPKVLVDCMKAAGDRGRIVLVGSASGTVEIGLQVELLRKELDIRASYHSALDYNPHPYWPWTRERNRAAIMRLIAAGDLKVDHLVSHVARPEQANELYNRIAAGPKGWMSVFFNWEGGPS